MADFRDVIYLPTRAVAQGGNPYDARLEPLATGVPRYRQRFPALNLFPLYSPLVLLLLGGFAIPSFYNAAGLFFLFNVLLLVGFAWIILRMVDSHYTSERVLWLATIMLATQAGRASILGGETSILLAIASLSAGYFARQYSWCGGWALAITSLKPTFGLPLGCLLLLRKAWGTVVIGWGLGLAIGMAGLLFIFSRAGDLDEFLPILKHNQSVLSDDPDVDPLRSSTRIDAAFPLARFTGVDHPLLTLGAFVGVMLIAALALQYLQDKHDEEATRLAQVTILIGTVAAMYHLIYDGLILWGAIGWLWFGAPAVWKRTSLRFRMIVGGLLLATQLNILPTASFQSAISKLGLGNATFPTWLTASAWAFACTFNSLCLIAALLLLAWHAQKWRTPDAERPC